MGATPEKERMKVKERITYVSILGQGRNARKDNKKQP